MTGPVPLRLFRPTPEQHALVAGARPVFAAAAGDPAPGRAARRGAPGWQALAGSGFLGALVPEERGGLGLGASDLVLLTEEAGALLVPGPLVETAWMVAPALAALGEPGAGPLAGVLAGELLASAVDGELRGPDLTEAALLLVPAPDGDRLVEAADAGPVEPVPTADRLERSGHAPALAGAPGRRVPAVGAGALAQGRLGGAAHLLGITRELLETTVGHVSARTQFGVPIGSFQAVRHALADVHVELEFARSAAWSAACEVDDRTPSADDAVLAAAVMARRAFAAAGRTCLQAHGGVGFTEEHPLHGRLERGATFAARFGRHRELAAALGERLLLQVAGEQPRPVPPRPHI